MNCLRPTTHLGEWKAIQMYMEVSHGTFRDGVGSVAIIGDVEVNRVPPTTKKKILMCERLMWEAIPSTHAGYFSIQELCHERL